MAMFGYIVEGVKFPIQFKGMVSVTAIVIQ